MTKKEIESFENVTLTKNSYDNTCTLTSDQAMDLKQFGVLLGFSANKKITANAATKSNRVNINRNLAYIKVLCDSVDRSAYTYNGYKLNLLFSLPIPTTQSLNGSIQGFFDIKSKVRTNKRVINQITFYLRDQDNMSFTRCKVLLDLYIM